MNFNTSQSGGFITLSPAELANRNIAISTNRNLNNIHDDVNIIFNRYIQDIIGIIPQFSSMEAKYKIDFTQFKFDPSQFTSKIVPNPIQFFYDSVFNHLSSNTDFVTSFTNYNLLNYVRSDTLNVPSTDTDDKIINSVSYSNYRSKFYSIFNLDESIRNLVNPLTWKQTRSNSSLTNFDLYLNSVNDLYKNLIIEHLSYSLLSTYNSSLPFTRSFYSKHLYTFLIKPLRSFTDPVFELYRSCYDDLGSKFELELLSNVNRFIIDILSNLVFTFNDINNLRKYFIYPTKFDHDNLYSHGIYDHYIHNIVSQCVEYSIQKDIFKAIFSDFIECDVYYHDMIDISVQDKIVISDEKMVQKIIIPVQSNMTFISNTFSCQSFYPTCYYEFVPQENKFNNICNFFTSYFLLNQLYDFSILINVFNSGRLSYDDRIPKIISLLFTFDTFKECKWFPQCINEYIGKCIGYINPTVDINGNYNKPKSVSKKRDVNVIVHGGEKNEIRQSVNNNSQISYGMYFSFICFAFVIILIGYICVNMCNRHERSQEKYISTHPRTYTIHDYVTNKVNCDGKHLYTDSVEELKNMKVKTGTIKIGSVTSSNSSVSVVNKDGTISVAKQVNSSSSGTSNGIMNKPIPMKKVVSQSLMITKKPVNGTSKSLTIKSIPKQTNSVAIVTKPVTTSKLTTSTTVKDPKENKVQIIVNPKEVVASNSIKNSIKVV